MANTRIAYKNICNDGHELNIGDTLIVNGHNIAIVDIGRNHIVTTSDSDLNLEETKNYLLSNSEGWSCHAYLMRNDSNTWFSFVFDQNQQMSRKMVKYPISCEMDELFKIMSEDDVTLQPELDEWWTKKTWRKEIRYHSKVSPFQVMMAREYARKAKYEPITDNTYFNIVAAQTAISS